MPTLTAAPHATGAGAVVLEVAVPVGQTSPRTLRRAGGGSPQRTRWRCRWSRPTSPPRGPRVVDRGATPWDATVRLAPWSTYSWRVEVLGAPEPGSSVPGAWSAPNAPVSWRVVPAAPVAVTGGTAVMTAAGVGVRFTSPDPLDGGPAGDYVLDVNRVSAAAPAPSDAVGSYSAAAIRQPDGSYRVIDARLDVVTGSTYLVEVCDPIGRRSARVVAATL